MLRTFAVASAAQAPEAASGGAADGAVLRTFGVGAQILKDLGVQRMRVLSAPKQMHGISAFGLEVEGYVGEEG
jgi:3,4-dihydroxy 2-butanone 4-phosphate synthase/GTP cyclohydrolase II